MLFAGMLAACGTGAAAQGSSEALPVEDAKTLAEVLVRVKEEYVEPVSDHQLLQAATHGMVSALDPFSEILESADFDEIKIDTRGNYSGLGLELSAQDGDILVVTPIDGSAAARAGILPGDVLVSIDGVALESATLSEVSRRLRGPDGSKVRLMIERENILEPLEFILQRSRVELHSVSSAWMSGEFGFVRIAQFSDTTAADLQAALRGLIARNSGKPLRGVVLDLRNNPGGVLESAVAVADRFLDHGVIVTAKGRTQESNFELDATPGDDLHGAPMVVMINAGSASAAEIVAGALKDQHRAVLIGRRSFGKGSVQTVFPLSQDRALKLTTSLYYTPAGTSINHIGIEPDIVLPRTASDDVQSAAALGTDAEARRALQELARAARTGASAQWH